MRTLTKAAPRGRPGDVDHMAMMRERLAAKRAQNMATGIRLRERRAALAVERDRRQRWLALRQAYINTGYGLVKDEVVDRALAEGQRPEDVPGLAPAMRARRQAERDAEQAERRARREAEYARQDAERVEAHRRAEPTCPCGGCRAYRRAAARAQATGVPS